MSSTASDANDYLSFPELAGRWGCSLNKLKRLVCSGKLVPSFVINHVAKKVRFTQETDGASGYWLPEVVPSEMGSDWDTSEPPSNLHDTWGMYYLLHPQVDTALSCRFFFFSKDRLHQQGKEDNNVCFMVSLGSGRRYADGITLDMVVSDGMITMAEIERYESAHHLLKSMQVLPQQEAQTKKVLQWHVVKPKRFQGYGLPLFKLLQREHENQKPLPPSVHDVLAIWREDKPHEIIKVLATGIDYYDSQESSKSADMRAIAATIKRMTRRIDD